MKTVGWILCGLAAGCFLHALRVARLVMQDISRMRRMNRSSDPDNRLGFGDPPWSLVFRYPGVAVYLAAAMVLALAGMYALAVFP
jgi:hypothetical protein